MDSQANDESIHFVLFPFMAQGHMIPIIDCGRMLAQSGIIISVVITPLNAARCQTIIDQAIESGLRIRLIQLPFPCEEAGLPRGCESLDTLPSMDLAANFYAATAKLQLPVENLFKGLNPRPCCIISDTLLPWTIHVANKFDVPRISFHGIPCFSLLCSRNYYLYKVFESIKTESEYFVMPGIPDRIEFTKAQLPGYMHKNLDDFGKQVLAAEAKNYGLIVNTFEELETAYVKEYKKTTKGKVWCLGPVSLCNKDNTAMAAQRGNKLSNDGYQCLEWLDSQEMNSVVYACLGSLCNLIPAQLIELGLGLELTNRPFIWVIRGGDNRSEELEKWIVENKFEERIKGRGLLFRGWAPQLLILSHPAIGGFLTHCGWNSTLEGICGGVPMITWPLFADQFCNEKLVVQTLKIGVKVGVEIPVKWGEEENVGVLVSKEDVKMAVGMLMNEGEGRRRRAKELGEMAKRATEEGGSSQLDMAMLIQDIVQQASNNTLKD
ncbi:Glycosyltransferase [Melia azedarach]|uniref:Glycosyltransferase n=1 Tax=Melia azedarach TaxID=155640 RepID=A0ACC1X635_MELAZ|nr:Glycosyltransferase [Melia azedarach]